MIGFHVSAAMRTRFALFRDFTQRVMLFPERCPRAAYRRQTQESSNQSRMRTYVSPAFSLDCLNSEGENVTLFRNVGTLRKIPKEGSPHGLSQFTFTAILRDMHKAHKSLSRVILNCQFLSLLKSRHFPGHLTRKQLPTNLYRQKY